MGDIFCAIATGLEPGIVSQLRQRRNYLNNYNRPDSTVARVGQHNAWAKITSFIENVGGGQWSMPAGIGSSSGTGIARAMVLRTIKNSVQQAGFPTVYEVGTTSELGLRPPPGISSIEVEAQPPLGAVLIATVKIKAWNLNQLSAVDLAYFRLGCSMLLEWGHSVYTTNSGRLETNPTSIDAFSYSTKDQILKALYDKRRNSSYNYEGMLGLVSNFSWEQLDDGSYDCTVKITGYGSIVESLKVNVFGSAPPTIFPVDPKSWKTAGTPPPPGAPPQPLPAVSQAINSNLGAFLIQLKQIGLDTYYITDAQWGQLFSTGLDLFNKYKAGSDDDFKHGYATAWMTREDRTNVPTLDSVNPIFWQMHTARGGGFSGDANGAGELDQDELICYVPLGVILAYINNACLVYDEASGSKKPAIYIDFNPSTNLCVTLRGHVSFNPKVCITDADIGGAYWTDLVHKLHGLDAISGELYSTGNSSSTSCFIKWGITGGSVNLPIAGAIMGIKVNVDYAIGLLDSLIDKSNNVPLGLFLTTMLDDITQAMGGINDFKLHYNQAGNVLRIIDAQYTNPTSNPQIPTLPVFGINSVARKYNLKTEASTKIGSMLAISARYNGSTVSAPTNQDVSAFASLYDGLQDRLLNQLTQQAGPVGAYTTHTKATAQYNALVDTAEAFNRQCQHITGNLNPTGVGRTQNLGTGFLQSLYWDEGTLESVLNYYSTALNKRKSGNNITGVNDGICNNGLMPLICNLTLDGVGGIPLFQAFAIPSNRLPATYVKNGIPKVVFTIAGVNHSISSNQWTTTVRGIMLVKPKNATII